MDGILKEFLQSAERDAEDKDIYLTTSSEITSPLPIQLLLLREIIEF